MENLGISGSTQGQAYGQDVTVPVYADSVITATVVRRLDKDLYLIAMQRGTIEARIAADLQEGKQYQLLVEKGGSPPELSVVAEGPARPDASGLTPEERRWLDDFAARAGIDGDKVDRRGLLTLLRSLGVGVDTPVEEAWARLKDVVLLLQKMDAVPPAVRQVLAQTMLASIDALLPLESAGTASSVLSRQLLQNVVMLSGQVPNWSAEDLRALQALLGAIKALPQGEQATLQAALAGLAKDAGAEGRLRERLGAMLAAATGADPVAARAAAATVDRLLGDPSARLLLFAGRSGEGGFQEAALPGGLSRQAAVSAYQNQAPGIQDGAVSGMLSQFTALGGRLDRLPLRDVLAAQDAWRGAPPGAMAVHRAGSLLFLAQELPAGERNFEASPLIPRGATEQFPIMLGRKAVLDPAATAVSVSRLQDFASSAQLPDTVFVDRLLKTWVAEGGLLSELRPSVPGVLAWNQLLGSRPELRQALLEYLTRPPAFLREAAPLAAEADGAAVLPATRQAVRDALQAVNLDQRQIPAKYLESVTRAVQAAAGEGVPPPKAMANTAAWLLSRGVDVTPAMLQALADVQSGQGVLAGLPRLIAQLKPLLQGLPADFTEVLDQAALALPAAGRDALRGVLSFYQSGDGERLRRFCEGLLRHLEESGQAGGRLSQVLRQVQTALEGSEARLAGIKYYNLQSSRGETPLLFEVPVAFGQQQADPALLRVWRRSSGGGDKGTEDSWKAVVDLDLAALGRVRGEITLQKGRLHLDVVAPRQESLDELRAQAGILVDRLKTQRLKGTLAFRLKKVVEEDGTLPLAGHVAVEAPQFKVDRAV